MEKETKIGKQYVIFDLEATCWEEKNDQVKEIIEIGAVRLNGDLEISGIFSEFVRPTINPELTEFCKTLTFIKQEEVDSAEIFSEAVGNFEKWIFSSGQDVKLVSWGYYDKNQLLQESVLKKYAGDIIKLLEKEHMSLKHEFARARKERTCGMKRALEKLNIPLDGTHHRGIDDARNIAKIFRTVFSEIQSRIPG